MAGPTKFSAAFDLGSRHRWLSVLITAMVMLDADSAWGADLLPLLPLDPQAAAGFQDASTLGPGTVAAAIQWRGESASVPGGGVLPAATRGNNQLDHADQVSALLGLPVAERLSVALGIHGSEGDPAPGAKQDLGLASLGAPSFGFSEATLALKAALIRTAEFNLALEPFMETGGEHSASATLTRPAGPRQGAQLIAAYGAEGVGEAVVSGGARRGATDAPDGLRLGLEDFYHLGVSANLLPSLRLLTGFDGRHVDVKEIGGSAGHSQSATQITGGLGWQLANVELSAYAAKALSAPSPYGYGDRSYGVGLTWHSEPERRPVAAAAVEKSEPVPPPAAVAPVLEAERVQPAETLPAGANAAQDSIGRNIDPEQALLPSSGQAGGLPPRQPASTLASPEDEEARIQKELGDIKAAESVADQERAKAATQDAVRHGVPLHEVRQDDQRLDQEWKAEAKRPEGGASGVEADELLDLPAAE